MVSDNVSLESQTVKIGGKERKFHGRMWPLKMIIMLVQPCRRL